MTCMQRPSYKPPSILILTVALLGACQLWAPRAGAAPDPNVAKTAERGWISREYHRIRNHLVLSETHRLVASGELENARHKLETHLRDQPRDIPARRQYLTVLDRLGLHPKVIQEATLLIDQDPEFRDARLYRAGAYQAVGRIREAVSDFQAVGIDQANEQADRIYALNMAADLALGQQLYSEALDSLAHLAAFSQTYAVYFRRGLALEGAGRVSSATEAYKLALERASTDEERLGALRGLGGTARKSGDSGAAYKVFSKAHQLRSDDVFVLRSLAEITRSQKQFRETAGWARQVLAITQDPSDREFLASVLYQSKDYSGAAREYSILKADVDPPRRVRAYRALANIAGRQGNFSSEKRHLMSALSLDSRNAEVLRALAHNSSKQRDYEASVNWIKKARAAQPKLEDHILLANGLIELGRFQDAVKQWTIVLSGLKVPRNRHPILVSLGHTHTLAGDQASATAAFRKAARIRPDVLTLTALAHSLEAAQSLSEAIEIWEAVLEQSPSPETHYRLGVLFAQAGEDLQALNHLSKAAQNGLSIELKASAYKQLGYLYQKSGQLRQALSAFEKAVTRDEKDSVLYLALGNLSMQMHEYGKAIHYFQLGLAIEHTPELIRGLTVAEVQASGELLQDADSHTKPALLKQAAERFLAAYEESDDADLLAQTAQAYYLAGDWPEASKTYERLMALPGLAQNTLGLALENLGFIALREGRSDQAVDFLSQAIKQGGAGSRLRQNLGLALYSERRWREALEQFHAASEEKKDSQVLIYVARCYKELNKPGLAIKFFREALAIGKSMQPSERREVLSELGYLYAGQPDYAEAASAWRQVLVLKEEPAVRIRLARVERLASEIENAQTTLETIEVGSLPSELIAEMGYLVDSSSHYILGVGVPALVASTIVL